MVHVSHKTVRQIAGSRSVSGIHPQKKEMRTDTIGALWHSIDFQWYLLTEQGVQWSQGELGSAGEQTQPSEWAKEDKKRSRHV